MKSAGGTMSPSAGRSDTAGGEKRKLAMAQSSSDLDTGAPLLPVSYPLLGREDELATISRFITRQMRKKKRGGSMCIFGKAGTGKTACLDQIYAQHEGRKCTINCMRIGNLKTVYWHILKELSRAGRLDDGLKLPSYPSKDGRFLDEVENILQDASHFKLIVLDEIDAFHGRYIAHLERIFSWGTLPGYYVLVIGLSNKLDLVSQLSSCRKMKLLSFLPYTSQQIADIVNLKLHLLKMDGESVQYDRHAISLLAKRTANYSGDLREALAVLDCSITEITAQSKKVRRRKPSGTGGFLEGVDADDRQTTVDISRVHAIMNEQCPRKRHSSLPFQQQMLICCGLLLTREGRPLTIGSLDERYSDMSQKEGHSRLAQSDLFHYCQRLESLGIFTIKKNKQKRNDRWSTVSIASDIDAEFLITSNVVLNDILNSSGEESFGD